MTRAINEICKHNIFEKKILSQNTTTMKKFVFHSLKQCNFPNVYHLRSQYFFSSLFFLSLFIFSCAFNKFSTTNYTWCVYEKIIWQSQLKKKSSLFEKKRKQSENVFNCKYIQLKWLCSTRWMCDGYRKVARETIGTSFNEIIYIVNKQWKKEVEGKLNSLIFLLLISSSKKSFFTRDFSSTYSRLLWKKLCYLCLKNKIT